MNFILKTVIALFASAAIASSSPVGEIQKQPIPYLVQPEVIIQWQDRLTPNMKKVAQCESGLNPMARGDGGNSWGILQLHLPSHPEVTKEQALDPNFSIDFALANDPSIWTCSRLLGVKKW